MPNPLPLQVLHLALLAALSLCSQSLPGQSTDQQGQQPDPVYTTAHLDGVVVSSLDGKPVPRVLVTSPDRRMAAITDSAGRFSFDFRRAAPQSSASHDLSSWPPNPVTAPASISLRLHVFRPGYVGDDVELHLPAVQPDAPEPPLQLKIVPAASLTGHLDPDAGDLPENLPVQLARKSVFNGTANWGYFTAQVNSRGEFRFANLPPGDFKLLAAAYLPQSKLKEPLPDSIPGFRTAFYPNAQDFDSAGILHLGPGEATRADLVYRGATFYNVVIPVTGLPDGKGFAADLLPDLPGVSITRDSQRHAAQGYLPNGDFDLRLTSADVSDSKGDFPTSSIASAHLQIDGKPIRTLPIAFHPAFDVPVEVRVEFTSGPVPQPDPQHPTPPGLAAASRLKGAGLGPRTHLLPSGATEIQNISEGLYRVFAESSIGGYVASLTSGTTDLLREPLRVLPGVAPRPIEIVLRDDAGSINARLARAANLLPQATSEQPVFILAIPLDHPMAQTVNLDVQRDFIQIPNLAPGRYLLLASHQQMGRSLSLTTGIEYFNEEVVHDLLNKGAVVTLSPGQTVDVEIPLLPEDAN
jgi:hypothetical protein